MSLRRMFDRKLVLMVVSPIARAVLSLAVGYLSAKGVPPNLLDQFAAAIGAAAIVVFNIAWELVERRRAAEKAVAAYRAHDDAVYMAFTDIRDRFDRESA